MAKLSRTSIPDKLITAKRSAMRYFSPKGTRALTEAAALSDPKHNVVGIGIGHKLVKGKSTSDHAIRFYVERKIDKKVIPKSFFFPSVSAMLEPTSLRQVVLSCSSLAGENA
jgi:hypothetical protein